MDDIIASVEFEKDVGTAGWGEVFTGKPRVRDRLFVGVLVMAPQQLCGANYFFYYGTTNFKAIGMDDSFATSMIFRAVYFASTLLHSMLSRGLVRRTCLMYGAGAMFVFS